MFIISMSKSSMVSSACLLCFCFAFRVQINANDAAGSAFNIADVFPVLLSDDLHNAKLAR